MLGLDVNSDGTKLVTVSHYRHKVCLHSLSGTSLGSCQQVGNGTYGSSNGYFIYPVDVAFDSDNNEVLRLLGVVGNFGDMLALDYKWAYNTTDKVVIRERRYVKLAGAFLRGRTNLTGIDLEDFLEGRAFLLGEMLGHHLVSLWLEPAAYMVEVAPIDETAASVKAWFEEEFSAPKLRDTSTCVFEGVVERSDLARRIEQAYWSLRREHASQLANWGNVEGYDALVATASHRLGG